MCGFLTTPIHISKICLWDNLLVDVNNFCFDSEHVISIPNMERAKVATASVDRAFSAMNIVKTDLHNKMGDDFLIDCLVCYVERDIFMRIDNEVIIQHFQNMRTRRLDVPPLPSEESLLCSTTASGSTVNKS